MAILPTSFDASVIEPFTEKDMSIASVSKRYRHIPPTMREGRWWMISMDKIPYRRIAPNAPPHSLIRADPHNSANHCSFNEALATISTNPSRIELMLVLGIGNNFICVDLDPLEKVAPEHRADATEYQRQIRERMDCTYSEVSRSGSGLHFIGVAPEVRHNKAAAKHPHFKTDLLFRQGLVLTGDHRSGTTEVADISSQIRTILYSMGKRPNSDAVALQPVDTLTPAHCNEKRLIKVLTSDRFAHGEAFRTGRNINDWSSTFKAILNSAAEFSTDEQLVYRIIQRSGLVQLAENKGSETRIAKLDRVWPQEWRDSLAKTEPTRRAKVARMEACELTLASLWDQTVYVKYMVQERATMMITQGLMDGMPPEDLAPLFHYLKPDRLNRLQDDLKKMDESFSQTCMSARILMEQDSDTEVSELNAYIHAVSLEEKAIGVKARFTEYNQHYYIIENHGGAAMVFEDSYDETSGAQRIWRIRAFCEAKGSEKIFVGWDQKDNAPIIKSSPHIWTGSDKSRRYVSQEMRFETTAQTITVETGRILNLFHGWAATPVAGDWSNIRYLIHDILCSGAEDASDYLLSYLAHMIQQPDKLPDVAVILQSEEQGTGKTTFMDLLREMLGARYCATTADASTLVGQFNASAMNKIMLHFEEAVAPNDRAVESKVKALITNKTMTYNQKGLATIEARNYARVFMTSNASQVAHLARHDRRMFVLNVSPRHANEAAFWSRAQTAYPREVEAFMHILHTRDISGFKPNVIPHTDAKDRQKLESVVSTDRILRDLLEAGRLPTCSQFVGNVWEVRVSALSDYFLKYNLKVGFHFPQPAKVFKPLVLAATRHRWISANGEPTRSHRVITIPPLSDARQRFLAHMNVASHDWGDSNNDDWALD